MRTLLLTSIAFCLALPAYADGFRVKNLERVKVYNSAFQKPDYRHGGTRTQLTIFCKKCSGTTAIGLELGRSTDGTEARYRSGEATLKKMEDICKSRSPSCKMRAVAIGGAVGWVTTYTLGDTKGSTAILFQDGDLLQIRSLSPSAKLTNDHMTAALTTLATQIVGPKK